MNKLLLIDGNAILHRAYHALPKTLTTTDGEPINAVYGFVSMLLTLISDLKPTHIAIAFDRKEPTFRHKEFKKYQSHRPETDKELIGQFAKSRDVVDAFSIPFYDKKGFEADDVIGTIAKKARLDKVIIVTGDKDILQLVDNEIKVYMPIRGLKEAQMMGKKEVFDKLGVKPEQIIDYKALVGDPSDNYPGVYGVGPKTAEVLLAKYNTYKEIYKHLDEIDENTAKKLKDGKKGGDISYKLAKIVTSVPIKYKLTDMNRWEMGNKKTIDLFAEYGFRSLTKRVIHLGEEIEKEKQLKLL